MWRFDYIEYILKAIIIAVVIAAVMLLPQLQKMPAGSVQAWEMDFYPGFASARVEPGQQFDYILEMRKDDTLLTGEMTVIFAEIDEEMVEIIVEGYFHDEEIFVTTAASRDNPASVFTGFSSALMTDLDSELSELFMSTFSFAGMMIGFYGEEFALGWELREDEDEEFMDEIMISIPEMRSFAGQEGYLVRLGEDDFIMAEFCHNPELVLPLMINFSSFIDEDIAAEMEIDEDWQEAAARVELVGFAEGVEIEADLAGRPSPGRILQEVVDHFRAAGLEVGARSPRYAGMMGAVDGFGLEIAGDEVEIYLFDSAAADENLAGRLVEAAETGKFHFEMMGMDIPVVMNGDIMLTGLEFGGFYTHSEKETIVEVFTGFESRM